MTSLFCIVFSVKNDTENYSVFLFGNFGSLKKEMIFLSRFAVLIEFISKQLKIQAEKRSDKSKLQSFFSPL